MTESDPPKEHDTDTPLPDRDWGLALLLGAFLSIFFFPALSYMSVVALWPAAAFLLASYGIWLLLRQSNRDTALAFAAGFIPATVMCMLYVVSVAPVRAGLVVLPVTVAIAVRQFIVSLPWLKSNQ